MNHTGTWAARRRWQAARYGDVAADADVGGDGSVGGTGGHGTGALAAASDSRSRQPADELAEAGGAEATP
jgi:hypothetical protein